MRCATSSAHVDELPGVGGAGRLPPSRAQVLLPSETAPPAARKGLALGRIGVIEQPTSAQHAMRAILGDTHLTRLRAVRGRSTPCHTAVLLSHRKAWSSGGEAMPHPSTQRKVYFYRVNAGTDEAGRPLAFNPEAILSHLQGQPFNDDGLYLVQPDGNVLFGAVDNIGNSQAIQLATRGNSQHRMRLATVRRSDLPQLEEGGRLSPLPLPQNAGLYEPIHVVFFSDNIVGAEFNFYGPRPSRLATYLRAKASDLSPPMTLDPLLRRDVTEQLSRLSNISLLDFTIRASYADTVEQINEDLGSALRAAARAGDPYDVEIVLRTKPRARREILRGQILDTVRQLARREDLRENTSRFRVRGYDTETRRCEEIDVLRDQLVVQTSVVKMSERTRAIASVSMYEAIEQAHEALYDDLRRAAGVIG